MVDILLEMSIAGVSESQPLRLQSQKMRNVDILLHTKKDQYVSDG